MTLRLLCFSLGIILVGYLPELPPLFVISAIWVVTLSLLLFRKKVSPFSFLLVIALNFFVAGGTFGVVAGHQLLVSQLPDVMAERDIIV